MTETPDDRSIVALCYLCGTWLECPDDAYHWAVAPRFHPTDGQCGCCREPFRSYQVQMQFGEISVFLMSYGKFRELLDRRTMGAEPREFSETSENPTSQKK
jgi:hypothetical protein